MAQKRTNYARIKVWGKTMSLECEGSILGCMEQMLMMLPAEFHAEAIKHLQNFAGELAVKREGT